MNTITLGAGCFWCIEAIFMQIVGVTNVQSGYMGGHPEMATYKDVSSGRSGHAEVVQINYDATIVSMEQLLEVFFKVHNPTTLNRQGDDVGTQYRSVIFYNNNEQKNIAFSIIKALSENDIWTGPIVTEISKASEFFSAEAYHDDYFEKNVNQPYCQMVVAPKMEKFKKTFENLLKKK